MLKHTHTGSLDFPEYYNNKLFLFRHFILEKTIFRMNHILVFKNNRIKLGTKYKDNISTVKRKCACVRVCARVRVLCVRVRVLCARLSKKLSMVDWILCIFCNPLHHMNTVLSNYSLLLIFICFSEFFNK